MAVTWTTCLSKASAFLDAKGVPDATLASELLMARLLKTGRGFLFSHFEEEVSERDVAAMRRALARLAKGEPIQYVLGEWDFRSLTLACDRRALIPRPETEGLVSLVLDFLKTRETQASAAPPILVDVGTGTGAIALSLAKESPCPIAVIGTDVSAEAISLARENAARTRLEGKVHFVVMDGLDDFDEPQSVDVIVSNPPYISTRACETLDPRVRDFEPRLALDGGSEGLDFYERYLLDALHILKPGGGVFFEIGASQGAALERMMTSYGLSDVRVSRDMAGLDRYASGRFL